MAKVKFSAVNSFVENLFNRTDAGSLENSHSGRIRSWFINNMSKIGRYAHRDHERFGNLVPSNRGVYQGRQDGWQSLTEEVPDPKHTTYGTGVVYIHGEIELPEGKPIANDCFSHTSPVGAAMDYIEGKFSAEVTGAFTQNGTKMSDLSIEVDPNDTDSQAGYVWELGVATPSADPIPYSQIVHSVSGIQGGTRQIISGAGGAYNVHGGYRGALRPTASKATPSVFNDDAVYELGNERNNYPMVIINSAAPVSIDRLLVNRINGQNGMYDNVLPALATGGDDKLPATSKMKVTAAGRKMLLDHISPLSSNPGD
jgi:hypothetical protein